MQDRDDYRENYPKNAGAGRPAWLASRLDSARKRRGRSAKTAGLRYLFYLLMMGPLWGGAHADYAQPPGQDNRAASRNISSDIGPEAKGVIIKADAKGHFRGVVLINNVPMPFLIDTGATDTVVPAKMAVAAKLPYGRYVQASTAGGKVAIRETSINSLRLGNAELNNLHAQLNDHLNEVLIGMSTLRYFKINQAGDTMTLISDIRTIPAQSLSGAELQNETSRGAGSKTSNIKKTVVCDERKVCITKYSDR
ncbi:TIGR02281 family clan AA aspartic protease [Methylomonas sp. SURF-2]|uniref:TIGR02281 family clan AA aspartic protease n=1 Tax=Methylomonas subterranea TaxID=2952225 RepID=A0ABT1TKN4_9GAMM|nr:TIGR02281 family clan AA aspartic protease [Methylomonas sp. SURF-2]MCQ8105647.1 TIGR02281 family clan AA aspartic protease [Methylomonas sp. SURF-2]